MQRKSFFSLFLLAGILINAACSPGKGTPVPEGQIPNPASVHCEQNGGALEIRQDATGGVSGVCKFPDGSECDEWAYFRGECSPGDSLSIPEPTPSASESESSTGMLSEFASDGCKIYRNDTLGYSFHYPPQAEISEADEPARSFTILGPMVGDYNWPVIYVSHPGDREEYRPPDGVDLEGWLVDHNLLALDAQQPTAEIQQPDVQIAGTKAIHTRLARSPQTYAFDKYYFARAGQLYVIVILHTGDLEDWGLYNHILGSFEFKM